MALFDNNPLYKNISSLTNPVTSGLGNLFEGMNIFGARPSEALTGILTPEQQDKLRNQSLLSGILNAGATYLAQPKNQNVGLGAILGKSYLGGMQGAQSSYDQALTGKVKQLELEQGAKRLELEGLSPTSRLIREKEARIAKNPNDPAISIIEAELAQSTALVKPEIKKLQDERAKLDPNSPTYKQELNEINQRINKEINFAPPTSVVNLPGQEKAESKAVGEFFGKTYADIQSAGASATNKINKVERLNTLLDGVQTGKLTPFGVDVASTAASLGFKIDPKLGNKQAADALSKEMALELRNPSGGAGMPGALSNSDREFLMSMTPGLTSDPAGRKLISESMVKLAKRDQDVAKLARDYRKRKGSLDEGFYDELAKFSDANPLFTKTNKTIEVQF
jgi:hypothetical protein